MYFKDNLSRIEVILTSVHLYYFGESHGCFDVWKIHVFSDMRCCVLYYNLNIDISISSSISAKMPRQRVLSLYHVVTCGQRDIVSWRRRLPVSLRTKTSLTSYHPQPPTSELALKCFCCCCCCICPSSPCADGPRQCLICVALSPRGLDTNPSNSLHSRLPSNETQRTTTDWSPPAFHWYSLKSVPALLQYG